MRNTWSRSALLEQPAASAGEVAGLDQQRQIDCAGQGLRDGDQPPEQRPGAAYAVVTVASSGLL
jgi:hypothetical protein